MQPDLAGLCRRVAAAAAAAAAAFALALAFPAAARADSVTYYLDQTNIESAFPDGISYLKVVLRSTNPSIVTFEVTPVFDFVEGGNYGFQKFAFNYRGPGPAPQARSIPDDWKIDPPPPSTMSGFGKFDYILRGKGDERVISVDFYLSGINASKPSQALAYFAWPSTGSAGEGNFYFAAHLAGFRADRITSGYFAGSSTYFVSDQSGGIAAVPLPAGHVLMLGGLGLLGIARRGRGPRT